MHIVVAIVLVLVVLVLISGNKDENRRSDIKRPKTESTAVAEAQKQVPLVVGFEGKIRAESADEATADSPPEQVLPYSKGIPTINKSEQQLDLEDGDQTE